MRFPLKELHRFRDLIDGRLGQSPAHAAPDLVPQPHEFQHTQFLFGHTGKKRTLQKILRLHAHFLRNRHAHTLGTAQVGLDILRAE